MKKMKNKLNVSPYRRHFERIIIKNGFSTKYLIQFSLFNTYVFIDCVFSTCGSLGLLPISLVNFIKWFIFESCRILCFLTVTNISKFTTEHSAAISSHFDVSVLIGWHIASFIFTQWCYNSLLSIFLNNLTLWKLCTEAKNALVLKD